MLEENYSSEYLTQRDDDTAIPYSLPYIEAPAQPSTVLQPTSSVPQPEQQKTQLTEIDRLAAA